MDGQWRPVKLLSDFVQETVDLLEGRRVFVTRGVPVVDEIAETSCAAVDLPFSGVPILGMLWITQAIVREPGQGTCPCLDCNFRSSGFPGLP